MTHSRELPPEFRLAAACCQWPPSPRRDQAIRAAAGPAIDWPRFLRVVRRQRIAGLAQAGLAGAGVALPPEIARELARRAAAIADRGGKYAAESLRLQGLFDRAGIPVLFLKGAVLAMLAYGSLSVKHGKDIDLLVSPDQAGAALALLENAGYRLLQPAPRLTGTQLREVLRYGKDVELVDRDGNLQVELHWKSAVNPMLLKGVGLSSPRQEVALAPGRSVRTLGEEDLFAYLCVHGALHAWFRLKWLADLNAFIAGKSDADVSRLYRHAQAIGAGLCAGQALLLCGRILQARLPPALASGLQGDRELERLAAAALAMMVGPDAETEVDDRPFGFTRIILAQFRLSSGWRYRLAHARITLVSVEDVLACPLPGALHFLYPVMYFPLWLLRHFRPRQRGLSPAPVRGA